MRRRLRGSGKWEGQVHDVSGRTRYVHLVWMDVAKGTKLSLSWIDRSIGEVSYSYLLAESTAEGKVFASFIFGCGEHDGVLGKKIPSVEEVSGWVERECMACALSIGPDEATT